jgi:excisionase family DNA binding protein
MDSLLLWKAREAAAALQISASSLWKLVRDGDIPVVRIGRNVRFDPADLRTWIAEQKTASAARGQSEAGSPCRQLNCEAKRAQLDLEPPIG